MNLPDGVKVYVFLVLARYQVHHGQGVSRGNVTHPVRYTRVRSVQVIVVTVFEYLQTRPSFNTKFNNENINIGKVGNSLYGTSLTYAVSTLTYAGLIQIGVFIYLV